MREVKTKACCVIEPRKIIVYQAKRCVTLQRVSLMYNVCNVCGLETN